MKLNAYAWFSYLMTKMINDYAIKISLYEIEEWLFSVEQ